jgi:hypothetical protein
VPGDVMAEFLKSQFDDAEKNRKDLLAKWEENRNYFLGIATDKWKKNEGVGWRSKSMPGVTHQKVIFAMALVLDTVLSGGKIPFMLKQSGFDRNRIRTAATDPQTLNRAIDDMTRLIEQQFLDCRAELVYAKNVLSGALYGWTYGKFLVNEVTRSGWEPVTPEVPGILDWQRVPESLQQWKPWSESFLAPAYVYVPVWNILRDWEIDDLHECYFVGQREIVNNYWLKQKIGKPFYIPNQIRAAIAASKNSTGTGTHSNPSINEERDEKSLPPVLRDIQARHSNQVYFERWGRVPKNIVEEFEKSMKENNGFSPISLMTNEDTGDEIEVCACSYNHEHTVRYVRTSPDMRPFFQAKWEDPGDELAPLGVADNCKQMHNVLKGTFRAIEDNSKLSANVIIALKERFFKEVPETFEPGTKLLLNEECNDARQAMQSVTIPSVVGPLMELLNVVRQFLDEDSMVPKISQGIREPGEQTASEASMRQASASKYIGMAIRNLDDGIVEPVINEFLKYNMNDPSVQVGKGNYLVQALGFTSFQNKTARVQALQQVLTLALSNEALMGQTKVRFYLEEIIKALDADPDQGLKTPDEIQAEQESAAADPSIKLQQDAAVAGIKKTESDALKNESAAVKNMADAGKKTAETEAMTIESMAMAAYGPGAPTLESASAEAQPQPQPEAEVSSEPVI